jgi:hypothetical protein
MANGCPNCLVASATLASAVTPIAWWPAPPLHPQPLYLQQFCWGMSCLTSPIHSLAWACLPIKIGQSSLHKPQSQSTTQTAIHSSKAGGMSLVHVSGIFLLPTRPLTPRMQPVPQLLGRPSQLLLHFLHHHPVSHNCPHHPQWSFHQPCLWQPTIIPARASLPPGVVHTYVHQKVMPINLIVRQNQPLKNKIHIKSTT